VKWGHLRQQGFLTIAIVVSAAIAVDMFTPVLELRGALLVIAIVALMLGWKPPVE
jgi:hypothetical protein